MSNRFTFFKSATLADLRSHLNENLESSWRELAGDQLDTLLHSRDDAKRFLTHDDAKLRRVAFHALMKRWKPEQDLASACRYAIENDPDCEVRIHALYFYAGLLRGTADLPSSKFLAGLVISADTSSLIRNVAYWALRRINGLPTNMALIRHLNTRSEHLFAIDYKYAASFLL